MLRHVPYPLPELFQRLLAPIVGNREPWRWTCHFPIVLTDGRFQQDADRSIGCVGSLPAQAKTESRASIDAKSASTVQEPSNGWRTTELFSTSSVFPAAFVNGEQTLGRVVFD